MFEELAVNDLIQIAKNNTIPISVLIEITYRCNEKCRHCYLNEHSSPSLSLSQYERLFDEMVQVGTLYVTFTGGEPFIRDDFVDILIASRKRRFSVTIFTNGTLINEGIAKDLKSLFIQEVVISLYSANPHIHDKITGVAGSFERSLHTIKMLTSFGIKVRLKCPLMNLTADHISSINNLARSLGVAIKFYPLITAKNNGDKTTWQLRLSQRQLLQFLADSELSGTARTPPTNDIEADAVLCDVIFDGGAIDPSGNVYPCNQLRVNFGNILSQNFNTIWKNSLEAQALRKITMSDLTACNHCNLLPFCSRCPGLALLEDGDILGCSRSAKAIADCRHNLNLYPMQSHIFSNFKRKEVRCYENNKKDIC